MGIIERILSSVFGGGRNILVETAEVFRENAEAGAQRDADERSQALAQFAAEFAARERGLFDRIMDGVNRLPRPAMALGTLGLFIAAMADPVWFSARMQGIALVPEPLWWLLGVVVSFYFGARHQYKSQELQRGIADTLARTPKVARNIEGLQRLRTPPAATEGDAALTLATLTPEANPALEEWRRKIT
ncbi:holin family protein [Roseovarius sp. LXJ103]|uniref:holin family protein n=1 Tax=Roseovarius carneus TaxID=2853164 RepID=UPI000D611255|nr:holin family protein [Roseovarius carneus]MBZ8119601.1 holin family protein [Roseovarius carneus]PWE34779.1 carboxylesterase [Pelagicola sp. LXJ1103]